LRVFDPLTASPEEWARLHALRHARVAEDWPGYPYTSEAEFERDLRKQDPTTESFRVIAAQDGEFVGNLILFFRRGGSPDWQAHAPFVSVWDGEYRSSENQLALDRLDWDELARWEAQATRPGDGLAWERHAGRVPMERLAALLPTFSALFFEQPLGILQIPPNPYELQNYITWYAEMDRRVGEHFLLLLRHGDEVAAMCDANWDGRFPERVYQQLTAVARPWRGKGLAKGLKAAMLRLIRARHPEARTMITNNAEVNPAIRSINERLGFTEHRRESTYQVGPEELARFIARQGERRGR
jgi:RimJ/RimL family protein N-acetyltransferase